MTTREKNEWLGRYRAARRAEKEIQMEIDAIEAEWIFPARKMDGTPAINGGGRKRDLSDMAADAEPLWKLLQAQKKKRIAIHKEIAEAVERSPLTENERAVLRCRYILCMQWEEIEDALAFEKSWLHRIRETAVDKLAI